MRVIGIRHRVKKTAKGEARPTQVSILTEGKTTNLELATETDELDFVLGRFPTSFRKVEKDEDVSSVLGHHIKFRKLKEEENKEDFHPSQVVKAGKGFEVASQVPSTFDGLRSGDKVAMMLGGSGDNLAFALARRGRDISSSVHRIPAFVFKSVREKATDEDALLLANSLSESPSSFYEVGPRDLSLIWLRECLRARVDAMKARITCEQRLRQHLIGAIFCSPDGLFPEGDIEKQFDKAKADDKIMQALTSEEGRRERELIKACEGLDIYNELFSPVTGLGPMIASRIIGAVIDIRRFETKAKLRAFCGVHVLLDGRFPRRRNNEVANWNGDCRQALFLLGDQFNRRPGSFWGTKLIAAKAKYRRDHPEPIITDSKLSWMFRRMEVFFRRNGVVIQPADFKVDSIDGLYAWFRACETELGEKAWPLADELEKWETEIDKVSVSHNTVQIFTAGHIHRMATWWTLGKFIESLFRDWWNLERGTTRPKSNPPTEIDSRPEEIAVSASPDEAGEAAA